MIKRFRESISIFLIIAISIIFIGCEPKVIEDTRPVAKGFIWEAISPRGESLTLVGTMHPAPKSHIILNDKLKDIIKNSDVLTLEVDITTDIARTKLQKELYLDGKDTIENYLSLEEINKLKEELKPYNQNISSIKKLTPYGINQVILSYELKKEGFDGSSTDVLLAQEAKMNNVEIDEIEGVDFQINLMKDIYSWDSLRKSLNESNSYTNIEDREFLINLFDNYVNSDIESAEVLEAYARKEIDEEYYNLMNIERNKGMANKIDELIKDGKRRIVAVGYRHYMGEDSVLDYLEEKGYTIKKIES